MTVDDALARWQLTVDGDPFETHSSRLVSVRRGDDRAMLKIAKVDEERRGADLMVWWNGSGAVRVLAHEGDALLLERATGDASLARLARSGGDDEAGRILASVAARLHAPRAGPPPGLVPLDAWFAPLAGVARRNGGVLHEAARAAHGLLDTPEDVVVLHGDLHHGNVLDVDVSVRGVDGWAAIDPKHLVGERTFDFANVLRNPDPEIATAPGRLARQATVLAEAAGVDRTRLLRWTLAFAGLSAAWATEAGTDPAPDLAVAELAAAEIAVA